MSRVLVTGGAGYIGSHFCKALSQTSHSIALFDNFERGHREAAKWGMVFEGNLLNFEFIDRVMAEFRPDVVVHFAALALVGESVADPALYYRNNVLGTLNLLDAMRAHNVSQIIFSSSCAVYGAPPREGRISEATPFAPISPYGATKAVMERALVDYQAYGIRSVSLRYFNAAGADKEGDIGEAHQPETHALPLMLEAIKGNGIFKIFGDDYATPDGTAIRDYLHVNDIACAHILAMDYLRAGGETTALNLGTGQGTSVRKLLEAVEAITGKTVPHELAPRRAGDPPVLVADASLASLLLGWKPTESGLEHIVQTAWNWHQNKKY